jgi:hypothetical protein
MAASIKITETFTIKSAAGDVYRVLEHTRCVTAKVGGVTRESLGRVFYKTEDGRGVLKNADDNTYAIPSLGIKAARREMQPTA